MRWITLLYLALLLPAVSLAQTDSTAAGDPEKDYAIEVDAVTYRMYLNGEWDDLRSYGEEALQLGYESYYLRMRVGIAQYNLGRYRAAAIHFARAREINPFEETASEYLYWCYIRTDRFDDAMRLAAKSSPELQHTTGFSAQKKITFALLEGGLKSSTNTGLYDPMSYVQTAVGHTVRNRVSVFHSVSWLSQSAVWGSYNQYQYYLRTNIPMAHNWYLTPAVHLVSFNSNSNLYTSAFSIVTSVAAGKQLRLVDAGGSAAWSNLNTGSEGQLTLYCTWFPLANNKVNIGAQVTGQTANGSSGTYLQYYGGYRPTARWNFSGAFSHGNVRYLNEGNGYLVNNSADQLHVRSSLTAAYQLRPRWDVYLTVQNEQRTEAVSGFHYAYNSAFIGIKFKP